VAELLRRIHLVEAWGRGIPLILEKEPDVEFKEIAQVFITSFKRPTYKKTTGETTGETTDKKLTKQEKAVIKIISSDPHITQKEMAAKLNLTEDGVRYHTDNLKSKGILKRIGSTKAGQWKVLNNGQ